MMRYTVITVKDLMLEEFEKDIEKVCQNKILLMQSGTRKEVFLLSKELYKTYEKLGKKVYMTGFYMGEIRKKFKISIEFGEKLAQVNTTRRIWVNRKGQKRRDKRRPKSPDTKPEKRLPRTRNTQKKR